MKQQLINFVSHWEGYIEGIYKDCAGYDTCYFGHLIKPAEVFNPPFSRAQGEEILWQDLQSAIHAVQKLIHPHLTDNQLVALTSFTFNLGSGALQRSQIRMCINRGDLIAGANKMILYDNAGGRKIQGLYLRREAEKQLFLQGD